VLVLADRYGVDLADSFTEMTNGIEHHLQALAAGPSHTSRGLILPPCCRSRRQRPS
jgi:hypothetical protein